MALGESLFWASIFLEDIYFSGVKFWSFFFVFSIMTIFRGFSILRGRIDIGLPLLQILLFLGLCFTCLSFLFLFFYQLSFQGCEGHCEEGRHKKRRTWMRKWKATMTIVWELEPPKLDDIPLGLFPLSFVIPLCYYPKSKGF